MDQPRSKRQGPQRCKAQAADVRLPRSLRRIARNGRNPADDPFAPMARDGIDTTCASAFHRDARAAIRCIRNRMTGAHAPYAHAFRTNSVLRLIAPNPSILQSMS